MRGPIVDVQRAPTGWTHIGGPGMHVLISLEEDDERTLVASDLADGGDLDDVIDFLTASGLRGAHHFVGVHWEPRTRIVAHGPVAATITLADGSERELRPRSARVWTDLELDEHPERVALRVLDEDEREQPVPPLTLADLALPTSLRSEPAPQSAPADGAESVREPEPAPEADAAEPTPAPAERVEAAFQPAPAAAAAADPAEPRPSTAPVVPAQADAPEPTAPEPTTQGTAQVTHAAGPTPQAEAKTGLPVWGGSGPAIAARRASDLAAAPADVDSTWTARPRLGDLSPRPDVAAVAVPGGTGPSEEAQHDRGTANTGSDQPPALDEPVPAPHDERSQTAGPRTPDVAPAPTVPSYDHLFGQTTDAAEYRRHLASLHDDAETADDAETTDAADLECAESATPVRADSGHSTGLGGAGSAHSTGVGAAGSAHSTGVGAAGSAHSTGSGSGLISSVPWARSSSASEPAAPALQPASPPAVQPAAPAAPAPQTGPLATAQAGVTPAPQSGASAPSQPGGIRTPSPAPSLLPPVTPVSPVSPVTEGPEEEQTIDRSALLRARDAARDQQISGPSVLAVLCESGHASPPHEERCRVCGAGIPRQEPLRVPRPSLGVLRLSTGAVVSLDRAVLLGRAPTTGDVAAHDRPHLVKVPSPERDISRNHVEVALDGWHVLVRDLGTTNGTTVALPGQQPVRLRASDQQVLEPGSVVSMADEVSFTFEVTA